MVLSKVVAAGCSYIAGSNIVGEDGKAVGDQYRVSKLLADKFKAEEVNLSIPGSGNSYIVNTLINYLLKNEDYTNIFVIVGLSGITRQEVYVNSIDEVRNLHLFDILRNKDSLPRRSKIITGQTDQEDNFYNYVDFQARHFFNLDYEKLKLRNLVSMLDSFLKVRNIPYVLFNSTEDNLIDIKSKINYISFLDNVNPEDTPDLETFRSDYYGKLKENGYELEDSWQHFLLYSHYKEFNNTLAQEDRSSTPPYGKYFCGGHPSPEANKELAEKIQAYINKKYVKII